MTTEQKAKAYDEAIERAKKLQETCDSQAVVGWCEYIFPELCESEDEKVRKVLVDYFKSYKEQGTCGAETFNGIPTDNILTWLEKQGEQKLPIEKLPEEMKSIGESLGFTTQEECEEYNQMVSDLIMSDDKSEQKPVVIIPKFRVGDIIRHKEQGFTCKIIAVDTEYRLSECNGTHLPFESQDAYELVEQKHVDKVEPKFKVGDWVVVSTTKGDKVVQIASVEYLKDGYPSYTTTEGRWFGNGTKARLLTDKDTETITLPESKFITYKAEEKQGEQKPTDNDMVEALRTEYEKGRADAIAQMKKEWSKEDEKMALGIEQIVNCASLLNIAPDKLDKVRNWLKSLKDRVQSQPKQEWSEEDSRNLSIAIQYVFQHGYLSTVDWLRNLKERYTWKPSEEQMKAVKRASNGSRAIAGNDYLIMETLYNDLKKLKE